ncbi:SdpI family protein [Corynebacterium sp. A21]|uniref:SdpI family protein n=1 Tax=Corynebacterium sp. A21 TaxID=3457318 RepID=UPI003FD5FB8B
MNMLIGVVLLVLALVLLIAGVMATSRRLPGNKIIGLRVPEVRKSKEIWDGSHAVAGPLWIFGGVALTFGGLIAFIASGWLWVFPAVTLVVGIVALASGANVGARTATLLDARHQDEDAGCASCSNDGGCGCGGHNEAPAPVVDLAAVRRAAEITNSPEN